MYKTEIISEFGTNYKLKSGAMWYKCPYHDGKGYTSFNVSIDKGLYKCFNCGAKGSIKQVKKEYKNNYIPQSTIQKEEIKKEFTQLPTNIKGFEYFISYLFTRLITFNINNLGLGDKFTYSKDYNNNNVLGLVVNNNARYNYVTDKYNKKVWKGWEKGSQASPLTLKHFLYSGNLKQLYIFEGLEDLIAYNQLYYSDIDYKVSKFICIFGISNFNKLSFENLDITYNICLDNDEASNNLVAKHSIFYQDNINLIEVEDLTCKDFNECLQKEVISSKMPQKQDYIKINEDIASKLYNMVSNANKISLEKKTELNNLIKAEWEHHNQNSIVICNSIVWMVEDSIKDTIYKDKTQFTDTDINKIKIGY